MPSIIPPATPEPPRREELRDDLAALLEMTLSPRDASDAVDTLDELVAAVFDEAADAVARFTGNDLDANAKMLRRLAAAARAAQSGGESGE